MNNHPNNRPYINFESDDSASSIVGRTSAPHNDADAAVVKLGNFIDYQIGALVMNTSCHFAHVESVPLSHTLSLLFPFAVSGAQEEASPKRKSDTPPSDAMGEGGSSPKKKKPLTVERREDRNLREKERSLKITQQIHELRNLLSMGGVIVPKVSGFGRPHHLNVTCQMSVHLYSFARHNRREPKAPYSRKQRITFAYSSSNSIVSRWINPN